MRHRVALQTRLARKPPVVQGDRIQLQQVLLNLIDSVRVRLVASEIAWFMSNGSRRGGSFLMRPRIRAMNFAGSIAITDDAAQRLPDLAHVRRPGVKPPQGGVGIGDDRADRLIDFVGNRGREVPQGDDPVGVDKRQRVLLLGFEQPHVFDRDTKQT
jgi:hypothetical protein